MNIKIYIMLLLLFTPFACTDDLSEEQFFATVKFEYVPKNKKLTFKKVEVQSIIMQEVYFLKVNNNYEPKPGADGFFTIPKGRYTILIKALVTFTDTKGVEHTEIFNQVEQGHTNIKESSILRFPLQNFSYNN